MGEMTVRPSKKNVSRPRPLHFLAPPLFFYYFLCATFFNIKAHCCRVHTKIMSIFTVNPLCVFKLNKLVFNQYLMFRFIIFDLRAPTYPWGEGNDV